MGNAKVQSMTANHGADGLLNALFGQLKSHHLKIVIFYIIYFMVGVAGLALPISRNLFIDLMPFSLILSSGLMFLVHERWKPKHIIVFAAIAAAGYAIEVAGVLTGEVFGAYTYGRALGIKIMETPLLIGLNWVMLIYALYALFRKTRLHVVNQILLASLLMVGYDVIMEPVAMQLDMWWWQGDMIPMQNYIAWFVISLFMLSFMHLTGIRYRNRVAPALFFIQMGFFLALYILL
jgi:bisanhydrobacterioruberin hydratase